MSPPSSPSSNEHKDDSNNSSNNSNSNSSNNSSNTTTTNTTTTNTTTTNTTTTNNSQTDSSHNEIDCIDISTNILPPIVNFTINETNQGTGYTVTNQQGSDISGTEITHSIFSTTEASEDVKISQDLAELVEIQYDDVSGNENGQIVHQIKAYAEKFKCEDFHGKGTIDDYTQLFVAASKIANESKQMELNVDIEGFNEFAQAADEMSELFSSFIIKLQNVNIINDLTFLRAILVALEKIYNLSEVFGKFKQTILATSTIQIPKSAHDTSVVLHGVMDEISCAMNYINHFVNPTSFVPVDAELSVIEKNIINKAVDTIDNWNVICETGISIALSNNEDITFINQASTILKTTTQNLKSNTQALKNKLALYNITKLC